MPKKPTSILIDSLGGKETPPLEPYLGRKKRWEKDTDKKDETENKKKKDVKAKFYISLHNYEQIISGKIRQWIRDLYARTILSKTRKRVS